MARKKQRGLLISRPPEEENILLCRTYALLSESCRKGRVKEEEEKLSQRRKETGYHTPSDLHRLKGPIDLEDRLSSGVEKNVL